MEKVDLLITFDTTGSMYPCLTQVRRGVSALVNDLFTRVPGLRVGIIAHGDYCDAGRPYVTKILDFTTDKKAIANFVNNVEPTGGGDAPECYELVLREARSLSWESGKSKVVVLIGDDVPHGPSYPQNTKKIDWRNELKMLLESNINVYGVHAMPDCRRHSKSFYQEIASTTGGFYLTLDQFANISDLITAIACKQESDEELETFIASVQASGRNNRNFINTINTLTGKKIEVVSNVSTDSGELVAVPRGRFQTLHVDETTVIADFVQSQGAKFSPGRGFYELTKYEKVQGNKEIVLQDKASGDLYSGEAARRILKLPLDGSDSKLSSKNALSTYKIFVQSNSYNRKLIGNTTFLYEVDDWDVGH